MRRRCDPIFDVYCCGDNFFCQRRRTSGFSAKCFRGLSGWASGSVAERFQNASTYFVKSLARDRANPELMEGAVSSLLALGKIKQAVPIAKAIEQLELRSQTASMVLIADLVMREDFDGVIARTGDNGGIGPLVDTLVSAWAKLGQGKAAAAFEEFDVVAENQGCPVLLPTTRQWHSRLLVTLKVLIVYSLAAMQMAHLLHAVGQWRVPKCYHNLIVTLMQSSRCALPSAMQQTLN